MSNGTVHTHTLKSDAQRALRKLRRGNILGSTQSIGRGNTMITVYVPSTMTPDQTGVALARALGDADYEPIVITAPDGSTRGVAAPTKPVGGIHKRIADQTKLAITYAEDGGFRSAASVLRRLADDIDAHVSAVEASMPWTNPNKE